MHTGEAAAGSVPRHNLHRSPWCCRHRPGRSHEQLGQSHVRPLHLVWSDSQVGMQVLCLCMLWEQGR